MACKKGFTIVEVMIAVVVFSTISLLTVIVVMGMARQYQKGSYTVQLNDASRSVHQDIRDTLAYGSTIQHGVLAGNKNYLCTGNIVYFWYNSGNNIINNGLYRTIKPTTDTCEDAATAGIGKNILPREGFVSSFTVTDWGGISEISTRFNVGTKDMYQNTTDFSQCLATLSGGDFCAVVNYKSSVKPRI